MKVRDIVEDLLKLDQGADFDIGDSEGYYNYKPENLKKINKPNGYKGYVLTTVSTKLEGEVKCEHLDNETIKPQIGMGVTFFYGSDCRPYTIVGISKNGRTLKVQEDDAVRLDHNGQSELQEYKYTPNPKGPIEMVSLRQDGRWKIKNTNTVVHVGSRRYYEDPHF